MTEKTDVRALLATNLRRARTNKGLSQLALAEQIGSAPTFINDIEHGRTWVSAKTVDRICKHLGLLPYQLFVPESMEVVEKDAAIAACYHEMVSETTKALRKVRDRYLG